jgi:hypothetical protein
MKPNASATWVGDLRRGKGVVTTRSGTLSQSQYFGTCDGERQGTNPYELVAAANEDAGAALTALDQKASLLRDLGPRVLLRGHAGNGDKHSLLVEVPAPSRGPVGSITPRSRVLRLCAQVLQVVGTRKPEWLLSADERESARGLQAGPRGAKNGKRWPATPLRFPGGAVRSVRLGQLPASRSGRGDDRQTW